MACKIIGQSDSPSLSSSSPIQLPSVVRRQGKKGKNLDFTLLGGHGGGVSSGARSAPVTLYLWKTGVAELMQRCTLAPTKSLEFLSVSTALDMNF